MESNTEIKVKLSFDSKDLERCMSRVIIKAEELQMALNKLDNSKATITIESKNIKPKWWQFWK